MGCLGSEMGGFQPSVKRPGCSQAVERPLERQGQGAQPATHAPGARGRDQRNGVSGISREQEPERRPGKCPMVKQDPGQGRKRKWPADKRGETCTKQRRLEREIA